MGGIGVARRDSSSGPKPGVGAHVAVVTKACVVGGHQVCLQHWHLREQVVLSKIAQGFV